MKDRSKLLTKHTPKCAKYKIMCKTCASTMQLKYDSAKVHCVNSHTFYSNRLQNQKEIQLHKIYILYIRQNEIYLKAINDFQYFTKMHSTKITHNRSDKYRGCVAIKIIT